MPTEPVDSDTPTVRDAADADPYAALCLLARRRRWRLLLAIQVGEPPHTSSRLSRLSLMDEKGGVRGRQIVGASLERAAHELLAKLAKTEKGAT